jgi:hypothetical protein
MSPARPFRKARSFLRHDGFVQAWFLPVWVGLGVARALVLTVSFRRMAPRFGRPVGDGGALAPICDAALERRAVLIAHTIRLAAAYTPWDSNCFAQAVVARALLGIYGVPYVLSFGVMRDNGKPSGIKAHAWVTCGRVVVSGGAGADRYAVVGRWVSAGLAGDATGD